LSLSKSVAPVILAALVTALIAAGCGGSSGSDEPTVLKIGVSEQGKKASFELPKSAEGGLVEVQLANEGKAPHGVQFVRFTEGHNEQEVLKELGGESEKTPDWIRGEGGIGAVGPGETGSATLNLEEGDFVVVDAATFGSESGPPATAPLKVTEGNEGDLPDTEGTVTAEEAGHDKYAWDISGLKAGKDEITFNSEGDKALHLILAVPVKGKAPSLDQIKKEFAEEKGPPPSYVEFEKAQSTAVLDGGKSQTTTLDLKKGQYIFFCPLTDRDGGKPHDQEGLLSVETVE
jgi:hypothetical protein